MKITTLLFLTLGPITLFGQLQTGPTWTNPGTCSNTHYTRDIDMTSTNIAYAVGDYGRVYKSTNGGSTWSIILSQASWISHVSFSSDQKGAILNSTDDKVRVTTNGGSIWSPGINLSGNMHAIDFNNTNVGYAVGFQYIHRSNDGGASFNNSQNIGSHTLYAIQVLDNNIAWAGGQSGQLYKTTNGGDQWTFINTTGMSTIRSINFTNALNGWIGADNGLWKTVDGGTTWTHLYSGTSIKDILFKTEELGYVIFDNKIYKTVNGGQQFNEISEVFNNKPSNIAGAISALDVFPGLTDKVMGAGYNFGSIVSFDYSCPGGSNGSSANCEWIGFIHDQNNNIRYDNAASCNFIDDENSWAWLSDTQSSEWSSFVTADNLGINGNNIWITARVWNGNSNLEVELWVYGTNNVGRVVYTGNSNFQYLTQIGTDDGYNSNIPNLVKDFSDWGFIQLNINNNILTSQFDGLFMASRSFNRSFGTIKGVKVTFKGNGAVSSVRITEGGNSQILYEEEFDDCNSNCDGCPAVRDMTQNSIPSGSWQASQLIYSDGDVNGNNNIEYRATECIELNPGFTVRSGGVFEANIGSCDNNGVNTNCYNPALITGETCTTIYDPVCGCDNITYSNACLAEVVFGISSTTPGVCSFNNTCSTAISLFVENPCKLVYGDNSNSTASGISPLPSCPGFGAGQDMWYKVETPFSGILTIEMMDDGGPSDFVLEAYTGTCNNLTYLDCDDDDGVGNFPFLALLNLNAFEVVYIRVWEFGNNETGPFTICAN